VKPARQDFPLTVSLRGLTADSKGVYALVPDEPIRIVIRSPRDVHVEICSLQQDGFRRLFPNEHEKDNLVRGGVQRVVPGNDEYTIEPEAANRVEFLRVVATTVKWNPVPGEKEGPFVFFKRGDPAHKNWVVQQRGLRGLKIRPKNPQISQSKSDPGTQAESLVTEVVLPYRVK